MKYLKQNSRNACSCSNELHIFAMIEFYQRKCSEKKIFKKFTSHGAVSRQDADVVTILHLMNLITPRNFLKI